MAEPQPRRSTAALFILQWVISGLSNAVTSTIALGPILGLAGADLAALVQRTLLFSGVATLVQTLLGHRMPIQEGPGAIWLGVFAVLAGAAPALGMALPQLRADLQLAVIAAGVLVVVIGALGLVRWLAARMTPLVTGCYLLLLCLQVSGPFLRGMAGGGSPDLKVFLLSLVTAAVIVAATVYGRGAVRSLSILSGLLVGWLLFLVTRAGGLPQFYTSAWLQAPELFAWGRPSLSAGILVTGLVTGLLCFINLIGAMAAMAAATQRQPTPADYSRGSLAMGVNHIISGVGGQAGIIVLTHSAALVSLMGSGSMGALRIAAVLISLLGLFPGVAAVFAAVPPPVGYAALFALFAQVAGFGLLSLKQAVEEPRSLTAIGLGLMAGVGAMLLPQPLLAELPPLLRFLAGNGLFVGTLTALLLEPLLTHRRAPAR